MTLKTNMVAWHAINSTTVKSLYDGSTQAITGPATTGQTIWGAYVVPHQISAGPPPVTETAAQALARFETNIGTGISLHRVYDSNAGPTKVMSAMQALGRFGTDIMVPSFKLDPVAVAAGTYDATITSFFQALPTNVMTYWSYYHEFDANINKGTFTFAQFVPAWKRVKQLADSVGNPKLKATLIYVGANGADPSHTFWGTGGRFQQYQPALDGYVDVIGTDPYQYASLSNQTAQQLCQPIYDEIQAWPIRYDWALTEIATKSRNSNLAGAEQFVQSLEWLEGKAIFVSYFNSPADNLGNNDEIDDIPVSAAYYNNHIRHIS